MPKITKITARQITKNQNGNISAAKIPTPNAAAPNPQIFLSKNFLKDKGTPPFNTMLQYIQNASGVLHRLMLFKKII